MPKKVLTPNDSIAPSAADFVGSEPNQDKDKQKNVILGSEATPESNEDVGRASMTVPVEKPVIPLAFTRTPDPLYPNHQGPTEEVAGILDAMPEGHGFLRPKFIPSN